MQFITKTFNLWQPKIIKPWMIHQKKLLKDSLREKKNYCLHSQQQLTTPKVGKVLKGNNLLGFFVSIFWNSTSNDIKNIKSYIEFRSKIKIWKPEYIYRLCQDYVQNLGFVNITSLEPRYFQDNFITYDIMLNLVIRCK